MLIRHLHELVDSGIIERHDQRTLPPCVRYYISPYGTTLVPLIESLCAWGRVHLERVYGTHQMTERMKVADFSRMTVAESSR